MVYPVTKRVLMEKSAVSLCVHSDQYKDATETLLGRHWWNSTCRGYMGSRIERPPPEGIMELMLWGQEFGATNFVCARRGRIYLYIS